MKGAEAMRKFQPDWIVAMGGGSPIDAAKYQFMILATIAALTLLADSIIMLMVYKRCFTALDQYQPVNG